MSIVEDIYKKIAPLASGEDLKIPEKVIDDFGEKLKKPLELGLLLISKLKV